MTERVRSAKEHNRGGLNRDVIKYIAAFTMLLNHIANIFLVPGTFLYQLLVDVGYFTAITMCYFLVEGYDYTHSRRNYLLRLLFSAVISELPFCLAFTEKGILEFCGMNMMFTLFLCFLIIMTVRGSLVGGRGKWIVSGLVLVSLISDWAVFAPAFTLLFLRDRGDRESLKRDYAYAAAAFGIACFLGMLDRLSLAANLLSTLGAMAAILCSGFCVLYLYNGKRMERGRTFSKWFFYLFYPGHLLALGLIRIFLQL